MFQKKYNAQNLKNQQQSEFGKYLQVSVKKFRKKYENLLSHQTAKKLTEFEEAMIIRVYLNYKLRKGNFRKPISKLNSEVSSLCGISIYTLHQIKSKYDIDCLANYQILNLKKEKEHIIPESLKPEIVNLIKSYDQKGRPITSSIIKEWLLDEKEIKVSKSTVLRALKRFNFKYFTIKCQDKNKFKDSVVERRKEYSKLFEHIVEIEKFNPIYIDESYVVKNHCRAKTCNLNNNFENFRRPKGKGNRIVIIGTIEKNGFLNNSIDYWIIKKNSDYHTNLNKENFKKYLIEKIIPNLKSPSVIILYNASYHFSFENISFNPFKANKPEIINFLKENRVKLNGYELKEELKDMALKIWKRQKMNLKYF